MFKTFLITAALAASTLAQAQAQAQAQTQTQTPAQTAATSSKKELTARLLQLVQPAVEGMAQQLVRQPAVQIQQGAGAALQRVPAERREAMARDIEADLRKYVDETGPIVRERALKLAPSTIGPLLESRFTEDELRQIIALLESPVNRKFQQFFPEMQRALADKLVADVRTEVEAKARALDQSVAKRLGLTLPAAASGPKK